MRSMKVEKADLPFRFINRKIDTGDTVGVDDI